MVRFPLNQLLEKMGKLEFLEELWLSGLDLGQSLRRLPVSVTRLGLRLVDDFSQEVSTFCTITAELRGSR